MTRIEDVQASMGQLGVDAVVLRLPENVMLATGWWVQIGGLGIAVVPKEVRVAPDSEYEADEATGYWHGDIRTFPAIRFDGPLATEIPRLLGELASEHGVRGGSIGYEGSYEAAAPAQIDGEPNAVAAPTMALIRTAFATETLVDVTAALEPIKARKSSHDLERLRITNEIACFGLDAFKEHAQGRTEAEIAAAVGSETWPEGMATRELVSSAAIPRSGPVPRHRQAGSTSAPAIAGSSRTTSSCSSSAPRPTDTGRITPGPSWPGGPLLVSARRSTPSTRRSGRRSPQPGRGRRGTRLMAPPASAAAGFEQFPHHTGHGVGFRYHEAMPWLTKGSEHVLEHGMAIVTEPGIYETGSAGFAGRTTRT